MATFCFRARSHSISHGCAFTSRHHSLAGLALLPPAAHYSLQTARPERSYPQAGTSCPGCQVSRRRGRGEAP
eukprot:12399531-Karenia_brevis.AAC.1